jgi:tetratricopeptide (TPR) repeat protein
MNPPPQSARQALLDTQTAFDEVRHAIKVGDHVNAAKVLEGVAERLEEVGELETEAVVLFVRAQELRLAGELKVADLVNQQARAALNTLLVSRRLPYQQRETALQADLERVRLLRDADNPGAALDLLEGLDEQRGSWDVASAEAWLAYERALTFAALDEPDAALEWAEIALAAAEQQGLGELRADAQFERAILLGQVGRYIDASRDSWSAALLSEDQKSLSLDPSMSLVTAKRWAETSSLAITAGDPIGAREALERALAALEGTGDQPVPAEAAHAALAYGNYLQASSGPAESGVVARVGADPLTVRTPAALASWAADLLLRRGRPQEAVIALRQAGARWATADRSISEEALDRAAAIDRQRERWIDWGRDVLAESAVLVSEPDRCRALLRSAVLDAERVAAPAVVRASLASASAIADTIPGAGVNQPHLALSQWFALDSYDGYRHVASGFEGPAGSIILEFGGGRARVATDVVTGRVLWFTEPAVTAPLSRCLGLSELGRGSLPLAYSPQSASSALAELTALHIAGAQATNSVAATLVMFQRWWALSRLGEIVVPEIGALRTELFERVDQATAELLVAVLYGDNIARLGQVTRSDLWHAASALGHPLLDEHLVGEHPNLSELASGMRTGSVRGGLRGLAAEFEVKNRDLAIADSIAAVNAGSARHAGTSALWSAASRAWRPHDPVFAAVCEWRSAPEISRIGFPSVFTPPLRTTAHWMVWDLTAWARQNAPSGQQLELAIPAVWAGLASNL